MKAQLILVLLFIIPFMGNAQFQGTITTTESVCLADGTIRISNANPTSEYLLTGSQIPQTGPFIPMMGQVIFNSLPKGSYTITEFKANNTQPTATATVPGNYEQNWIFSAKVDYQPCNNGTPTVDITNFAILNATASEQRPPYTYRISTKNGSLPADGSTPPPFLNVSTFSIPFPGGMNGNYEIQSQDACGNYKTISVFVPLTAPGPTLNVAFNNFTNCAGDANYTATATGGNPNYTFTIIAPSTDQVGTTQTTSGTANFTLSGNGTYTIRVTDQCGGITNRTVNVKPYVGPSFNVWGAEGSCMPPPMTGTGAVNLNVLADGLGPYSVTVSSDCGHPTFTVNNLTLGANLNLIANLPRPCNYTFVVTDNCGRTATRTQNLTIPSIGGLATDSYYECPDAGSTLLKRYIYAGFGPPYAPTSPFMIELYDSNNNPVAGYPLTNALSFTRPALAPGTYTYQFTDACGATSGLIPITIATYQNPTVSVDVNNRCFGAGQAILVGVNNNPVKPSEYKYVIKAGPTRVGAVPETDSDPNTGKFSNLQSGGTYTFTFNDGCKDVDIEVTIPEYMQPTWEVGFGAICPGSTTSKLEVINLQPEGLVVGPYMWRITGEDSDIYTTPLPFPSSMGQTSPTFSNLPPKNAAQAVATYTILGNDACKNSFQGTGKVGVLPTQTLILDVTNICADGQAVIRARVSTPIAGGTYVYYRDGVEVARSTNLFTFIMNAMPGSYTGRAFPNIDTDPTCFEESPAVIVTGGLEVACSVVQQPTCADANAGAITVVASNGTEPYIYLWSNGATTATISNLSAGTYTVTVCDETLCMLTCSATLLAPTLCCNINALTAQNVECIDNSTPGIISDNKLKFNLLAINTSNTLTTYNVTVNNGTTITPTTGTYGAPREFTLGAGTGGGGSTFVVTLTDSTNPNCTQTVTITDPGTCQPSNPPCETPNCGTATIQTNGN